MGFPGLPVAMIQFHAQVTSMYVHIVCSVCLCMCVCVCVCVCVPVLSIIVLCQNECGIVFHIYTPLCTLNVYILYVCMWLVAHLISTSILIIISGANKLINQRK